MATRVRPTGWRAATVVELFRQLAAGRAWRTCSALLLVILLSGCAALPPGPLGAPSTALPAGTHTPLGRLVTAASPDADLSGFRLMPDGAFALDTRLQLIARARESLDLQYYQIDNDETGRWLLRALRDAAGRGVRVRLLVDDMYTAGKDLLLLGLAAHPGVELRLFNPFAAGRDRLSMRVLTGLFDLLRVNRRMHNKLFIADGAMAVAGGRNIGSVWSARPPTTAACRCRTWTACATTWPN